MRVLFQCFEIAHAVVAGPGLEHIAKRKRAQRRIATGAAAVNHQAIAVNFAKTRQKLRAVYAIVHVNDSPLPIQPFAISSSIAGAAAVVHVEDREPAAGPILNDER